jgi:hypothetical protein
VQFSVAEAVAPGRFRLSGLLRGRRGTEEQVEGHGSEERFVLLDLSALISIDLPTDFLGRDLRVRAAGVDDDASPPVHVRYLAQSLKPLAPVSLKLSYTEGGVEATWTRRSRDGYAWLDHIDAPLTEAVEAYQVTITINGTQAAMTTVATPAFTYLPEPAVGTERQLSFSIRQVSAQAGPGDAVEAGIMLPSNGEPQ